MTLARTLAPPRVDLLRVAELVAPGSRVLDVGCGDGELLRLLVEERNVDGRGIELSQQGVNDCVAKGLSVIQGDADADLVDYPDDAFDYVILSQTLQATRQPRVVLEHMLRIGAPRHRFGPEFRPLESSGAARPSRPDAGDRNAYLSPGTTRRTSISAPSPISSRSRASVGATIDKSTALDPHGRPLNPIWPKWAWNLLGEQAIFLLHRETVSAARLLTAPPPRRQRNPG